MKMFFVFASFVSLFASAAQAASTETVTLNCAGPDAVWNAAAIQGTLLLADDGQGGTRATGVLDLTLTRRGPHSPTQITGLAVDGVVVYSKDVDGKTVRTVKFYDAGQGLAYIQLALDLPQFASVIRTTDDVRYRSNCK